MLVCASIVCSALCFDEDDKRMICHEIINKFGYRCVLAIVSFSSNARRIPDFHGKKIDTGDIP